MSEESNKGGRLPTTKELLDHVKKKIAEGHRPKRSVLKKYNPDRIEYWRHLRAKEIQLFGDSRKGVPMILPHPHEIRAARLELGLSQKEAAEIVGATELDWQKWETNPMLDSYELISGAAWERFLVQTEDLRPENSGFTFRRRGVPPIPSY